MPRKKAMPVNVIHDSCANCRFWRRLDDSEQIPEADVIGECRRYPPVVFGLDLGTEAPIQSFPETEAQTCCGEHGRAVN